MIWNADESESEGSDVATSNVRKDLNEFQEKHATLVLTTVKVNSYFMNFFYFYEILFSCECVLYWFHTVEELHLCYHM